LKNETAALAERYDLFHAVIRHKRIL
jgi:hypothetical protein